MGHNTNILKAALNQGKIFLRAKLIDDVLHEQNKRKFTDNMTVKSGVTVLTQHKANIKNVEKIKDKIVYNKTERLRSVTEQNNEFLKNLKNLKKLHNDEIYEDIEEDYGK
jgi:ribosomal protein L13